MYSPSYEAILSKRPAEELSSFSLEIKDITVRQNKAQLIGGIIFFSPDQDWFGVEYINRKWSSMSSTFICLYCLGSRCQVEGCDVV